MKHWDIEDWMFFGGCAAVAGLALSFFVGVPFWWHKEHQQDIAEVQACTRPSYRSVSTDIYVYNCDNKDAISVRIRPQDVARIKEAQR